MVNIKLNDYEDALNKFNDSELSEELDNYIMRCCGNLALAKKNISICITGVNSKANQEKLTEIIHNFYKDRVRFYQRIDKLDNYFRVTLLALGMFIFLISEQLTSFIGEVLLIIGWILIWEFGYDVLFNGVNRRKKAQIYKLLSKCDIEFK